MSADDLKAQFERATVAKKDANNAIKTFMDQNPNAQKTDDDKHPNYISLIADVRKANDAYEKAKQQSIVSQNKNNAPPPTPPHPARLARPATPAVPGTPAPTVPATPAPATSVKVTKAKNEHIIDKMKTCVVYGDNEEKCTADTDCVFKDGECLYKTGDSIDDLNDILDFFGIDKSQIKKNGSVPKDVLTEINKKIDEINVELAKVKASSESYLSSVPIKFSDVVDDNVVVLGMDQQRRSAMVRSVGAEIDRKLHNVTNNYNVQMESTYKVIIGRIELMQTLINTIKRLKNSKRDIDRTMRKSLIMKLMYMLQGTQSLMNGVINSVSVPINGNASAMSVAKVIGGRKTVSKTSSKRTTVKGGDSSSPFI